MNIDTYLQITGSKLDDLKQNMRPQAEKQVKIRLALEQIAKVENLTAAAEDVEAEYAKLAAMYNMEVDKVKAALPASELEADIVVKKAIDLVKASAEIKEVAKKTEAKKPAAKKTTTKAEGEKKPAAKKTTTTKKTTTAKKTTAKEEKAE